MKGIKLIAFVALTSVTIASWPQAAQADEKLTMEQFLKNVREERLQFENEKQDKEKQKTEISSQQEEVLKDIKYLDEEAARINEEIRMLQPEKTAIVRDIENQKQEIKIITDIMEKREKVISERLRTIQDQGGRVSYIEVFLGVKSFSEFIDRAITTKAILDSDKKIMETHYRDLQRKEEMEKELQNKLASLEESEIKLLALKEEQQVKAEEKNKVMQALQKEKEYIEADLLNIEEIQALVEAQEKAIVAEMDARKAKPAPEKKEEPIKGKKEERLRQKAPIKQGDGLFIVPTTGSVTSEYGMRWGSPHAGIDIADGSPDTEVVAAASGTVIRSYYSSSYGNVVFVTHQLNGQTFTTVYAHLENRLVETGEQISQGQLLGYMGNTGHSTGKHLHFEIHEGLWDLEKSNSVDPREYIKI
ncbi:peptidoglycan DD-metalloendopeptidase family protein [Bacillus sp. FJAT-27251]|uniref:murein hydrolase activator EnvC family protein n=1 Tax=Bacillus sp. FJAT-27251 TaxID=1684142 RepID=UPI0006A7E3D8|nr:peptidoglycan DD-metalloendopeptidase family protein [Bacillus sp. FJAT-27251]